VTGASGFLGSQVVDQLLDAGFYVRGTARSKSAPRVSASYESFGDRFRTVIVEDLATSDLTEAFEGVDAVIHVASPMARSAPPDILIKTAVDGTTRILEAAVAAHAQKAVITSSIVALATLEHLSTSVTIGTDDWSPLTHKDALQSDASASLVYAASKALADRAAWAFAQGHPALSVTSIYPPVMLGRAGRGYAIDAPASGTNGMVYALVSGPAGRAVPAVRAAVGTFLNVADAARAHVNALQLAGAPTRIIPNAGEYSWVRAVRHLAARRPELSVRLPVVEGDGPPMPAHAVFDNSSAKLVGFGAYISFEETVEAVVDEALRREEEL
ncbi:NAD-P-binding protein, partial [Auriscalpium vulgare]